MAETFHVVPVARHESLVRAAYLARGFAETEAMDAARLATAATRHGIRTHNAIKAIDLDSHFGSKAGGCVPRATIRRLPSRFDACQTWDACKKLGQSVAWEAIETCIGLADVHAPRAGVQDRRRRVAGQGPAAGPGRQKMGISAHAAILAIPSISGNDPSPGAFRLPLSIG